MRRLGLTMLATTALLAACGDAATAESAAPAIAGMADIAGAAAATAPTSENGVMQTVDIVDRLGFDQPVSVGKIGVPAGWRPEGGVNWDNSTPCAANQMKFMWRAAAPDGVSAVEMMPGFSWLSPAARVQMNPCPAAQIGSAQQFLAMVAQTNRPGSQMMGYRDRSDLIANNGDSSGGRNEMGELTIRYTVRGVPVEEVLSALVTLGSGGGGTAGYVFAYRAPAGRLDPAAFDRIRASFRGNRDYIAMIGQRGSATIQRHAAAQSAAISQWHNARMAEISAKGASDRAAIRAQGNAETNVIYADTARSTSATNDAIHANTIRGIREESTWSNPNTGQVVQGSIHGGQRVLDMGDGSYARTNDPYSNPSGSTEMNPQ